MLNAIPDVNRHPLETCELHRSIDAVFARSSFSKHVLLYPTYLEDCTMYSCTIHLGL